MNNPNFHKISLTVRCFSTNKRNSKAHVLITGGQGSLQFLNSRNPKGYKKLLRALLSLKYLQFLYTTSYVIGLGNNKNACRLKCQALTKQDIKRKDSPISLFSLITLNAQRAEKMSQNNLNSIPRSSLAYCLKLYKKVKRQNKNYSNTLNKYPNKYGIIRIDTGFTNINISFTTLEGKIINWINGGSDSTQTKRTRMSSRAVGDLMDRFLERFRKNIRRKRIQFIKVLFVGPSTRLRSKLFSMVQKKTRNFKFSIICKEEGFRRSFNGCRLSRRKR